MYKSYIKWLGMLLPGCRPMVEKEVDLELLLEESSDVGLESGALAAVQSLSEL